MYAFYAVQAKPRLEFHSIIIFTNYCGGIVTNFSVEQQQKNYEKQHNKNQPIRNIDEIHQRQSISLVFVLSDALV